MGDNSYLEDGEVLQDAVHHVLLREVLQLVDEADHVLAHRGTLDAIHVPTVLKPGRTDRCKYNRS